MWRLYVLSNAGDSVKVGAWTVGQPHQVTFPLTSVSFPDTAKTIWWDNGDADTGTIQVKSGGFTTELTGTPTYYSAFPPVSPLPAPGVPLLSLPADLAAGVAREATFTWSGSTSYFGVNYRLEVATDSSVESNGSFDSHNVVIDTVLTDTLLHLALPLDSTTTYYWHVSSFNPGGSSRYSPVYSFKTGALAAAPAPPSNISPVLLATGVAREPKFVWSSSLYSDEYQFQIATSYSIYSSGDSTGLFLAQDVILDSTLADTRLQLKTPLDSLTAYY